MTCPSGARVINSPRQKFGLLLNPSSGTVVKDIKNIRSVLGSIPGLLISEASMPSEFALAVESFRSHQVSHLIIIGGDGTVQSVLNLYLNIANEQDLPHVLILPGGTTNMTARDLGIRGLNKNLNKLNKLINQNEKWREIQKPLVKLELSDNKITYGFFFAIGSIANGVQFFNQHIKKSGITGEIASLIAVIPFLFKLVKSPDDNDLNQSIIQMDIDGCCRENCRLKVFFATTLDRLLFGTKPYWGNGTSPVHVMFIKSNAIRFWRTFLRIVFKGGSGLKEADGYFSSNSNNISLVFDGCFIIDGEIFYLQPQGRIKLSASTPVTFIVP